MCIGPKPKVPTVPEEDPILRRELKRKIQSEREVRSENKDQRFADALLMMGGYGRRGLLTGARGGRGFSGGRGLLGIFG